ncbi:MAG: threonine synthase [Candidatus Altiarchaeota archaeon]
MSDILYESTNGKAEKVPFRQVLLAGQAPDGGLYVPESIPGLSPDEISSFKDKPYADVAYAVTGKFLEGELPANELWRIVEDAYSFPVPLEKVFDRVHVMRLDRGPTAAFKDFAARMMARLMSFFIIQEDRRLLILTATSGDTGSAVAHAFYGVDNIDVVVLFPEREVTGMQRRQMTTLGGNISCIAVDGKFDDCQRLVKSAFSDVELEGLGLSSANSINFGRLLPQTVYYFYAYANLFEEDGEQIVFSVPSGNFGNLMGGVFAREMGLPVKRFVVATNENDEFPRFISSGVYEPISPSRECISNAMNVGNPSNLARLVHLYGGFLDEKGFLQKKPDMQSLRRDFYSTSISNTETRDAIKEVYEKYSMILEPHGAVGWAGLMKYLGESAWNGLSVSLETADPAKFPEEITKALGVKPELPESMKDLEDKEEDYRKMKSDYSALKKYLLDGFA